MATGTYYPTGTTFNFATPTYYNPGEFLFGNDSVAMNVITTGSTGPLVTGTVGLGFAGTGVNSLVATINTSQVNHWLVGQTGVVYLIGAESAGSGSNVTPGSFRVIDAGGGAVTNNILISGATASVKINGSSSAITLNTAYGVKTFLQVPLAPTGTNQTATENNWISF